MLSVASPKTCFSRTVKKMPDNCAGTQRCFTSLWMFKGSDQLSVKEHSALHVLDRERMMLRSLGGHPVLGRILNRPSLPMLTSSKAFVGFMKATKSCCRCSLHILCSCQRENTISMVDLLVRKPHCDSG